MERNGTLPRVSIVLAAFNQERFVEQAVKAVFAQDYGNLEIVLSDDASSDSTYEIMEHLTESYSGPHEVILNRTAGGNGILAHFYSAVAKSTGRLIVGAAGDDISYPHRVSCLVNLWQESQADAIFSSFDYIDEDGDICLLYTSPSPRDS